MGGAVPPRENHRIELIILRTTLLKCEITDPFKVQIIFIENMNCARVTSVHFERFLLKTRSFRGLYIFHVYIFILIEY